MICNMSLSVATEQAAAIQSRQPQSDRASRNPVTGGGATEQRALSVERRSASDSTETVTAARCCAIEARSAQSHIASPVARQPDGIDTILRSMDELCRATSALWRS
jgi:hypothetical protein